MNTRIVLLIHFVEQQVYTTAVCQPASKHGPEAGRLSLWSQIGMRQHTFICTMYIVYVLLILKQFSLQLLIE